MPVIVGGVVEKDGKFLLVQERKAKCYGKWNIPAGHLDANEYVIDGAIREIKEESGFDVELTGICSIGKRASYEEGFVAIIFSTKITGGEINFDPEELLDAKWFSYEEIYAMQGELRTPPLILGAIKSVREGNAASLNLIVNQD